MRLVVCNFSLTKLPWHIEHPTFDGRFHVVLHKVPVRFDIIKKYLILSKNQGW